MVAEDLAQATELDAAASLLDLDDLEAEETPESLMLATIGGSASFASYSFARMLSRASGESRERLPFAL